MTNPSPQNPSANFLVTVVLALGAFWLFVFATSIQATSAQDRLPPPKMVFAHYMVCCPAAGNRATVEDFEREIRTAMSYGIDGFVLNLPDWKREPNYRELASRIVAAAEAMPPFKVFASFDDVSAEVSASMLVELSKSPAYLTVDGRPVVSTYSGVADWGGKLIKQLAPSHIKPFIVPNYQYLSHAFWARNFAPPTARFLDQVYRDFPETDGYFVFGPDLGYITPPLDGAIVAERSRVANKVSMVGISPYYRGLGINYRVFESGGFAGMAAQWTSAIEAGANWIELVTWNDWGESTYLAPYGGITDQNVWNYHWGPLLSHEAFLKASRYFIDWFKSSKRPEIDHPSIYYFYRLHPKSAYGIALPDTGEQGRPKGARDLVDGIYVTAFLPKPLTVNVTVDCRLQSATLAAGVQHHRFEMAEGPITIEVRDKDRVIARKQLEFPITKLGQIGNFNYFAGEVPLP